MENKDFEEINDMLGDVIGGVSEQGLFQFSCDAAAADKVSCSELCFTSCDTNATGSISGSKQGTVTQETIKGQH